MKDREIENILVKYLSNSANTSDLDTLQEWIKDPKNEKTFREFVEVHFAATFGLSEFELEEVRARLLHEIRKDKKALRIRRTNTLLKYAALAILFVGLGYFMGRESFQEQAQIAQTPSAETITLEMDDGNIVVIAENGSSEIRDAKGNVLGSQDGTKLVYGNGETTEDLIFNTLSIPYGKRFDILLSDGTHVFLNSGSSIRYPVRFLPGKDRQVFLKGEAFFDVTHDESHPFVVNAEALDVQVLGTSFNVMSYPEDPSTEVVLVEGSVELSSANGQRENNEIVLLEPGFKGSFNKANSSISTREVNTALYTSWIEGKMVFRNVSFDNIIRKLERHYNVNIRNDNETMRRDSFNATIEVDEESIEEVLETFKLLNRLNNPDGPGSMEYTISGNQIIIN